MVIGDFKVEPVEVTDPPRDTVSKLAFSPVESILAVASWDHAVRLYEIDGMMQSRGLAMYTHDGPVLDFSWAADGSAVFSAGGDCAVYAFHRHTGDKMQVAEHEKAVRCVRHVEGPKNIHLVTAGWDLKLRNSSPIGSVRFSRQVCAMDANNSQVVVCTDDHRAHVFALSSPFVRYRVIELSNTVMMPRVVSFFPQPTAMPTAMGGRATSALPPKPAFAVGCMDGRVCVQHIHEKDEKVKVRTSAGMKEAAFSFRCHRATHNMRGATGTGITGINSSSNGKGNGGVPKLAVRDRSQDVYAVNTLAHHASGTFVTGGGDGGLAFWDGMWRSRLSTLTALELDNGDFSVTPAVGSMPIVAAAYNHTGDMLAYAYGYDWSKGHEHVPFDKPAARIMIHLLRDEEFTPKGK